MGMDYDLRNIVYRGDSGGQVVDDGLTKLTYDMETISQGTSNWSVSDGNEFSVVREDGTGFFASELELDDFTGVMYISARPPTDEEITRILEEYEERGLEEMAEREKEWQNYLQGIFIDTSRRKFEDVSDFASKAENILESRDQGRVIEGVSKIYSDEELGF
jgi:hypothetical protein